MVEVCRKVPQAVVCLSSALRFHELTTENPFEVWIALKQGAWTPSFEYPPIRVVRFSGPSLTFGAVAVSYTHLPALSFVARHFDSVAQRPLCRLADLFNPFEDVFALPFVNRHPEGLPTVWGLDDRNRQIAADVCLRF